MAQFYTKEYAKNTYKTVSKSVVLRLRVRASLAPSNPPLPLQLNTRAMASSYKSKLLTDGCLFSVVELVVTTLNGCPRLPLEDCCYIPRSLLLQSTKTVLNLSSNLPPNCQDFVVVPVLSSSPQIVVQKPLQETVVTHL
jgi:hypothetical protein